jgi:hypothetical protein
VLLHASQLKKNIKKLYVLRDKVKFCLYLTEHYAMKVYGGLDIYIHICIFDHINDCLCGLVV